MNSAKFLSILTLLLLLGAVGKPKLSYAQHIVINELMASNSATIADEDGDFEDWIEVFNAGHHSVNLNGFGLSDNPYNLFKWQFPQVDLHPGEFLLVWASGKNRSHPDSSLHTSFSISSAGEDILLTSSQGIILDHVRPLVLPADISFGRQNDGMAGWVFFEVATPGQPNVADGFVSILPPPVFSHPSGFYTDPFQLEITSPETGATIYYTLDGSLPDPQNLNSTTFQYKNVYPQDPGDPFGEFLTSSIHTKIYEGSILIVDRTPFPDSLTQKAGAYFQPPFYFPDEPVFKGTVVRAVTHKPGHLPGPVVTAFYYVNPLGREKFSLPVINFSTSSNHLFDYHNGIYNPGYDFDSWREQFPNLPVNHGSPANYHRRGDEWELPANLTFFEPGSSIANFQQDIGFRLHGGWTRAYPQKSLRLYARSRYGKSELSYPFFPDQNDLHYRRLVLRNSGQDWFVSMFKDALIQRVVGNLNVETQAYRPTVLFLNGEYWGIYNIRERYDRHYLERVFGIDPDKIDLLEMNAVVKEGDSLHYLQSLQYILDNDITQNQHYQWITTRIDIENYIDYQIAHIYAGNGDWPGNNIDFWRLRTNEYIPDAPYGHDGRWRWLVFDMDFGFGFSPPSSIHNTLAFAMEEGNDDWPNPDWSTFLLRNLMTNETFRLQFITRFADLINTHFTSQRINSIIDEMQAVIQPELENHIERWKQPPSMSQWNFNLNHVRSFINQRPNRQRTHIRDVFAIPSNAIVNLDVSDPDHGYIRINTVDVRSSTPGVAEQPYPWTGVYFTGIPIRLEAIPFAGSIFSHWEGTDQGQGNVVFANPEHLAGITAHFVSQDPSEYIHYWHFNQVPFSLPLESIPADDSFHTRGMISYPGIGGGFADAVSDGTSQNMIPGNEPVSSLRVRNPSQSRSLQMHIPTVGFENIAVSYAFKRTTNGAQSQSLHVSTNGGGSWQTVAGPYDVHEQWKQAWYSLSDIPGTENNNNLHIRIDFSGSNASGSDGNNRFDNITIKGDPIWEMKHFYSKAEGDFTELSTWGDQTDGSGLPPESFHQDATVFRIQNRNQANLGSTWEISGSGTALEIGDRLNPVSFTIEPGASLEARVKVNKFAQLELKSASVPAELYIRPGSLVAFSANGVQHIPANYYSDLVLENGTKSFQGTCVVKGDLWIAEATLNASALMQWVWEGNVHYQGAVDTQHPYHFNILMSGPQHQFVSAEGSKINGYNIYLRKEDAGVVLDTDIYARNNLRLEFFGNAVFDDGGKTLQLDDDLRIRADDAQNINLSGTIALTASSGTNDFEHIQVPLHNLVIDVSGDARPDFLGLRDMLIIKNNFIIRSRSSRPVRLRDKYIQVKGDFTTDITNAAQIETGTSNIYLSGDKPQVVNHLGYQDAGILANLLIDNPSGVFLASDVVVDGWIHWNSGLINTDDEHLLKLSATGNVNKFTPNGFTHGPMGISRFSGTPFSMLFATGKQPHSRPVWFKANGADAGSVFVKAEYFHEQPPGAPLSGDLEEIASVGYYVISMPDQVNFSGAVAGFDLSGVEIPASDIRVAMLHEGQWTDMGAAFDPLQTLVYTTSVFQLPATFTLARGPSGINHISEDKMPAFNMYPNPVKSGAMLYLERPADIWLYEITGNLVAYHQQATRIIVPDLSPGIYLVGNPSSGFVKLIITP